MARSFDRYLYAARAGICATGYILRNRVAARSRSHGFALHSVDLQDEHNEEFAPVALPDRERAGHYSIEPGQGPGSDDVGSFGARVVELGQGCLGALETSLVGETGYGPAERLDNVAG